MDGYRTKTAWTNTMIALVKLRFGEGKSFSEIAREISLTFNVDVTRSAIASQTRRYGLISPKSKPVGGRQPQYPWAELDGFIETAIANGLTAEKVIFEVESTFGVHLNHNTLCGRARKKGWIWSALKQREILAQDGLTSKERYNAERRIRKAEPSALTLPEVVTSPTMKSIRALLVVPQPRRERGPIERGYGIVDAVLKMPTLGACRWPEGDPKSPYFHFCCDPAEIKQSYCEHHREMARGKVVAPMRASDPTVRRLSSEEMKERA